MRKLTILALPVVAMLLVSCGADRLFRRGEPVFEEQRDESIDPVEFFGSKVFSLLESSCKGCHPNPAANYQTAKGKIVVGKVEESVLYTKASGKAHMVVWAKGSVQLETMAKWINAEAGNVEPQPQPEPEVVLDKPFFDAKVLGLLNTNVFESDPPGCTGCHTKDNIPENSQLSCKKCHPSGPPNDLMKWNFQKASMMVVVGKPEESLLFQVASAKHNGMEVPKDSDAYKNLEAWIKGAK